MGVKVPASETGQGELTLFCQFSHLNDAPSQPASLAGSQGLITFTWMWQGLARESDLPCTNTLHAHSPAGGPSMAPHGPALSSQGHGGSAPASAPCDKACPPLTQFCPPCNVTYEEE